MQVYEIVGFPTGVSRAGVNFLQPVDAFQEIKDGFIYRQILQSRQGFGYFAPQLAGEERVFGIFEHIHPDETKELLVIDENQLYTYNTGTGIFDPIPFGGTLAAYGGFAISAKDFYVSGTSYPTATNGTRFVFTGIGMDISGGNSGIFFYNGTDVRDFTNVADNPDYQNPLIGGAPTQLNYANYVAWFGERLNFIGPTIGGIDYNQSVLYSGIRNSSGNGDKFAVAGAGMIPADISDYVTGINLLGQVLLLNFNRSTWTLEKTTDAFNPYFIRKIPSELGTDAKFSAVAWKDVVKSLGKTGILGTDGRQSVRIDNKIPYFTSSEIDQIDFNLTYGGFDRLNNQFIWAYKESEVDTDTQNKVLVNNYEEDTWSVYDMRFSVFGETDIGLNLTWDDINETSGNESWAQWDTTEEIWDRIGLGAAVQKTLAGDDLGFIYQLNLDYDDYLTNITAITQASNAVLTINNSGFQAGDRVVVQNVLGMTEINNFDPSLNINDSNYAQSIKDFEPYTVISATPASVTLNVDSTLFTAYSSEGTLSKIISFKAKTIPFNPFRNQGRRCYISYVEFLIDTNGGFLKVDVLADEEETPYRQDVLLLPNTVLKKRQWITMSVNNEANFHTFVLKQESPAAQVKITSIRIHASPGGFTNG